MSREQARSSPAADRCCGRRVPHRLGMCWSESVLGVHHIARTETGDFGIIPNSVRVRMQMLQAASIRFGSYGKPHRSTRPVPKSMEPLARSRDSVRLSVDRRASRRSLRGPSVRCPAEQSQFNSTLPTGLRDPTTRRSEIRCVLDFSFAALPNPLDCGFLPRPDGRVGLACPEALRAD